MRLGWLLGLRLRWLLATGAAVGEHLIELLFLRIGQQGFNAIAAVLHHALYAGATVARSQGSVGAESLNLLLAIGDDGADLGLLRTGEPKLPGEELCLALRVCGTALGAGLSG